MSYLRRLDDLSHTYPDKVNADLLGSMRRNVRCSALISPSRLPARTTAGARLRVLFAIRHIVLEALHSVEGTFNEGTRKRPKLFR